MTILLYIVQGFFAWMGFGMILGFFTAHAHIGLLLGGIAYGGAFYVSFQLMAWWPLVVGFAAAWGLRFLGLDPGPNG